MMSGVPDVMCPCYVYLYVAFLNSHHVFAPHFLKSVVEVMAPGQTHLKTVVGVSIGMLSVRTFVPNIFNVVALKFEAVSGPLTKQR